MSAPGRPRKERRVSYVIGQAHENQHCSGVTALLDKVPAAGGGHTLFSAGRDGTVRRWQDADGANPTWSATFEAHTDWVNDIALVGEDRLVSASSDTTIKVWNASSSGECLQTFREHSDYVTSLAAAKQVPVVASAGLGCEVFVWDLEAALRPVVRAAPDPAPSPLPAVPAPGLASSTRTAPPLARTSSAPTPGPLAGSLHGSGAVPALEGPRLSSSGSAAGASGSGEGYRPVACKGHKQSVYALAINEAGTLLVSGSTENAIRVWDPRSGQKQFKLRGHTDNVRALVLDPSGKFCLSGSSDAIIRLWDLGQQRCIHSYAVHTDSVWALAANSAFDHVFSGGRDGCIYSTDLSSRESVLLAVEPQPVLAIALAERAPSPPSLWASTPASDLHRWPAASPAGAPSAVRRASSFVAGSLAITRARASVDGSAAPVPVASRPLATIAGSPAIVQHAVLNDRRHVLTKDSAGEVQLWELTRGQVEQSYGQVDFEQKEKELFEMVSVASWFTMDTRLGSISVHLETPQCFAAEMYATDLAMPNVSDDLKLNLGEYTLRGLFSHWLAGRREREKRQPPPDPAPQDSPSAPGDSPGPPTPDPQDRRQSDSQPEAGPASLPPAFQFSSAAPPSIMTEGAEGGPWRRRATELTGDEGDESIPGWAREALHGKLPQRDQAKCSFHLVPVEGSGLKALTQGKLSAPRILRVHKVTNYVIERLQLDVPSALSDSGPPDAHPGGASSNGSVDTGQPERAPTKSTRVEILCNDQVLKPEWSLATVKAYVWKKPEDLLLQYRTVVVAA
ncbi:Transducin/WD40 repeat-like superfamily protein [Klebsormidium nitens]|uniref:Transducin/WD40 repeat-like superfamily protein n=1 Tax=Klebsormidium nitens TaxID=105231 RepID=A0A1Y1IF03_KLENI|nr:Transducin/WD40 repeat-like superfamily protein [Klebsormidium nitens]|eukprot:GAQ87661.1 Transducin/WD40 repeat-like superfamily protein [Klebsormidium nitens]